MISEVVAVTIGNAAGQEMLRNAMAMGAGRGILIRVDGALRPQREVDGGLETVGRRDRARISAGCVRRHCVATATIVERI